MMERMFAPVELKFSDGATGAFEGYASVFGVRDSHADVVEPGAFKTTIAEMKARGFNVPMRLMHGAMGGTDNLPVGVWTSIEEDSTGLAVKGAMLGLDTEIGKYKYSLVKGGALRGMSIGYQVPAGGATYGRSANEPRRRLKTINLVEISLVDNPSNPLSSVTGIKSAADIATIREFEDFLRDAGGFSRAAAKAIASSGFKAADPRDEDEAGAVAEAIRRNIATLSRR